TLPKLAVQTELRGFAGTIDAADVIAAVDAGKTSWSEAAATKLAAATGMTPSEAIYVWAGCPSPNERNLIDKDLRETLGLKANQASLARDAANRLDLGKRVVAIDEAARAGVAALLDGSAVDALAAAWVKQFGRRVAIPEELIHEADELGLGGNAATQIAM